MTTWEDVVEAAPELAEVVRGRFEATGLGYLATVRRDGSPRISGIEPWFGGGRLWIGSMDGARKAQDLRRDPRFSLHAANVDKEVADGDARISGGAVEIDPADERWDQALAAFVEVTGHDVPPGPMHLFCLEPDEVVFLRPAGDHLLIRTWTPARGERTIARH